MTGIGLYGDNGHQIERLLEGHPRARLVGTAAFAGAGTPNGAKAYESLDDMLADPEVQLVSLCSPRRSEQAEHAIRCMRAGRHVYAEKPCALSMEELDRIVSTSRETGMTFREMAGTAFSEPYASLREVVESGVLGEIIQVFAQKSYPFHAKRPQDEGVDGGLLLQAGIHAFRMVEHVTGLRIEKVAAYETKCGNPEPGGGLHMAATIAMTLGNGGTAAILVNYLNQPGHGKWGNEHLRIFGRDGFVESTDGGLRTRLVVGQEDRGAVAVKENRVSHFDMLIDMIQNGKNMPLTMEEELQPLRAALRAKQAAAG